MSFSNASYHCFLYVNLFISPTNLIAIKGIINIHSPSEAGNLPNMCQMNQVWSWKQKSIAYGYSGSWWQTANKGAMPLTVQMQASLRYSWRLNYTLWKTGERPVPGYPSKHSRNPKYTGMVLNTNLLMEYGLHDIVPQPFIYYTWSSSVFQICFPSNFWTYVFA